MLVLSVIDASKDVFGAAGAKDKRKASCAANDARAQPAAVVGPPGSGATEEVRPESGQPETPAAAADGEAAKELEDRGAAELEARLRVPERRPRRVGVRRETPGWRAWEAR